MEEANKVSQEVTAAKTVEETVETETVAETESQETAAEVAAEATEEVAEKEEHEVTLAEKIELAERGSAPAPAQKQKMNLPNKLTLSRIILVPVMVVLFYIGAFWSSVAATVVFIIAAVTDFLDGYLARKNDIVTDFGKFLDPIADKLLVVTAIILINSSTSVASVFSYIGMSSVWMDIFLIIIVAREFAISGLRLVAANNGTVIAADKLGKIKTLTQTISLPIIMAGNAMFIKLYGIYVYDVYYYTEAQILNFNAAINAFYYIMYAGLIIYAISTVICLISGIQYLVKNKQAFLMSK